LFNVLNSRLERGGLLLAAESLPRDAGFALGDLASRASLAAVYRLKPLDDTHLEPAIASQAAARGLEIDAAASAYLLSRVSRDLGELVGWLEHLDRVSLAEQRRITVPLLRREIERRTGESA
jgi:DnaA family protein